MKHEVTMTMDQLKQIKREEREPLQARIKELEEEKLALSETTNKQKARIKEYEFAILDNIQPATSGLRMMVEKYRKGELAATTGKELLEDQDRRTGLAFLAAAWERICSRQCWTRLDAEKGSTVGTGEYRASWRDILTVMNALKLQGYKDPHAKNPCPSCGADDYTGLDCYECEAVRSRRLIPTLQGRISQLERELNKEKR